MYLLILLLCSYFVKVPLIIPTICHNNPYQGISSIPIKLLSLVAHLQKFKVGSWWRPRKWETTFGRRTEVMQSPSSQVFRGNQPTQKVSFTVIVLILALIGCVPSVQCVCTLPVLCKLKAASSIFFLEAYWCTVCTSRTDGLWFCPWLSTFEAWMVLKGF